MTTLLKSKLHSARKEMRRQIERQRKRLSLLSHPAIAETWGMFPISVRRSISISVSDWSDCVYFALILDKLDSLKDDPRLLRVLEPFTTPDWKAETSDWAGGSEPNRDYKFTQRIVRDGEPSLTIFVNVNAYARSDSPTCRIVTSVREEVVKKEERRIICA